MFVISRAADSDQLIRNRVQRQRNDTNHAPPYPNLRAFLTETESYWKEKGSELILRSILAHLFVIHVS